MPSNINFTSDPTFSLLFREPYQEHFYELKIDRFRKGGTKLFFNTQDYKITKIHFKIYLKNDLKKFLAKVHKL